jgi:hypothetical protein
VTVVAAVIVTVQVAPLVLVHPLQLANVEPVAGVAVNVTVAPWFTVSLQSVPQSIPQSIPVPLTAPLPRRLRPAHRGHLGPYGRFSRVAVYKYTPLGFRACGPICLAMHGLAWRRGESSGLELELRGHGRCARAEPRRHRDHRADDRSQITVVKWQHATSTRCAGDTAQRFVEPRVLVMLQMRDSECRRKKTVRAC